ncbi:MAG TPA: ATP synthase subunit I [Burkholderiaceae bacterium]|nr:ATP synthase subunit I [Burkholderiaceae bacterium]
MMFRVVLAQFIASLVVAALAGAVAGLHAAISALLGALACSLPNGLFALNLALLGRVRPPRSSREGLAPGSPGIGVILIGEVCKVFLMVGLLALIVRSDKGVVWPALIFGVGAVLLIQPVALAWRQR